jgi:hypothetical protein
MSITTADGLAGGVPGGVAVPAATAGPAVPGAGMVSGAGAGVGAAICDGTMSGHEQ